MLRRNAGDAAAGGDPTPRVGDLLATPVLDAAMGAWAGPVLVACVLLLLLVAIHTATREPGRWRDVSTLDRRRRADDPAPARRKSRGRSPSPRRGSGHARSDEWTPDGAS